MTLAEARSVKLRSEQLNRQQLSPEAKASDIIFNDGIDLQTKYENGLLVDRNALTWVNAVSPTVVVTENSNTAFRLKIQAINGTITTPNLKGATADELSGRIQSAIEELEARVNVLVDRTQLQRAIDSLQGEIDGLAEQVGQFESDVAALDARVTTLHNQETDAINIIQATLANKADRSELVDAYDKTETDALLNLKLDISAYNQEKPQEYESVDAFPEEGAAGRLYIDTSEDMLYRWDEDEQNYILLYGNTTYGTSTDDDIDNLFN